MNYTLIKADSPMDSNVQASSFSALFSFPLSTYKSKRPMPSGVGANRRRLTPWAGVICAIEDIPNIQRKVGVLCSIWNLYKYNRIILCQASAAPRTQGFDLEEVSGRPVIPYKNIANIDIQLDSLENFKKKHRLGGRYCKKRQIDQQVHQG